MGHIKAIETSYNGYRFRSRTEARWAVFLDALGVKYEYEREGYVLPPNNTRYLPDFWLPALDCFMEVKGELPKKEEQIKLTTLTENEKHIGLLLSGAPDFIANEGYVYAFGGFVGFGAFMECLHCGEIGIVAYPPGDKEHMFLRLRCKHKGEEEEFYMTTDSYCIQSAFTEARQARFEFGEKGRKL